MNQPTAEFTSPTGGSSAGERTIIAPILLRNLQRAAQVRSLASMASVFPSGILGYLLFGEIGSALGFFGGFFGVEALMTRFYCRPAVRCPHCGGSLWYCGTGNFKPRRMRLRADAQECRQCRAAIR